jgi:hypothetical protein
MRVSGYGANWQQYHVQISRSNLAEGTVSWPTLLLADCAAERIMQAAHVAVLSSFACTFYSAQYKHTHAREREGGGCGSNLAELWPECTASVANKKLI